MRFKEDFGNNKTATARFVDTQQLKSDSKSTLLDLTLQYSNRNSDNKSKRDLLEKIKLLTKAIEVNEQITTSNGNEDVIVNLEGLYDINICQKCKDIDIKDNEK